VVERALLISATTVEASTKGHRVVGSCGGSRFEGRSSKFEARGAGGLQRLDVRDSLVDCENSQGKVQSGVERVQAKITSGYCRYILREGDLYPVSSHQQTTARRYSKMAGIQCGGGRAESQESWIISYQHSNNRDA
jgi:hypothetical protein